MQSKPKHRSYRFLFSRVDGLSIHWHWAYGRGSYGPPSARDDRCRWPSRIDLPGDGDPVHLFALAGFIRLKGIV
jgi:hypothetical protein